MRARVRLYQDGVTEGVEVFLKFPQFQQFLCPFARSAQKSRRCLIGQLYFRIDATG